MPRAWFPSGGTSGGSCESAGGEADWGCAASAQVGPGAAWASMADTNMFLFIYFLLILRRPRDVWDRFENLVKILSGERC